MNHLFILFFVDRPGETKTTVSPYIPGGVSDGQWHSVQLHYYNKVKNVISCSSSVSFSSSPPSSLSLNGLIKISFEALQSHPN